ncbi:hypothetical protein [Lactobacillus sp. ESL0681]|uniref:hypothetical protein n=1 Tax=Lactobacillus sp. ESL0681 TaxID=2983211 RepID=UPI0023F6C688|nr:hypothetical protein [Lactobacillus sp. ESL0681]WEV40310.1 hypothetical protein OZX59_09100 [Lactobacillus sp. ESL0681]
MFKNPNLKVFRKEYLSSKKEYLNSKRRVDANMKKASAEFDKLHKENEIQSDQIKKDIEKYLC